MNIKGKDIHPPDEDYLREKIEIVKRQKEKKKDVEGFKEVVGKQKERSPQKEMIAKRARENNSPQKRLKNLNDFIEGI